jgi:tetratricopeptide (TPR) repeat protein
VTFQHSGAGSGSRKDFDMLLKNRGRCFGRGFVDAVFHGGNPFGNSDNYLSIYTGYFSVPKQGKYKFATASDDASFLSVDDKLVVTWSGKHNVWASGGYRGRFRQEVDLAKGVHSFRYDHIEYTHAQVAAAYIQRPGEKRLGVLKFQMPEQARVINVERKGGEYEPFVVIRETGEIDAAGTLYMVVTDLFAMKGASDYEWETGDGNRVKGRKARHIYLWEGIYPITLHYTVKGKKKSVSLKRFIRFNGQRKEMSKEIDFMNTITGYDIAAMGKPAFIKIVKYALKTGRDLSKTFLDKGEAFLAEMDINDLTGMADIYTRKKDYDKALDFIKKGLERYSRKELRAQLLIKQGDIYFYFKKDYPRAIRSFREVTKNPFLKGRGDFRLAFIRLGDVYRERNRKGDFDLSMVYYSKAEDLNTDTHSALKNGYYTHGVLDLINKKDYDNALKMLEEWEFNFPTEKLRGFSSLQRARINYLNKKYEEAAKQSLNFIKINPATTYIADFYMLIGASYYRQKDLAKASLYYKKVTASCPESAKGKKAEIMVERIKKEAK